MITTCLCILTLVISLNEALVKKVSPLEKTSQFWINEGQADIEAQLRRIDNTLSAKNIILFIGDGMGPSTITAARDYKNQQMVNSVAPDVGIFFEGFPNTAIMKTHSVDAYVADSSSTATALVSGVKTNSGVVGVSPEVLYNNCSTHNNSKYDLDNIGEMFHRKGKSVGIVTTARITHATPSVLYAHSASRQWESSVPSGCSKHDIAYQLIDKSETFNVLLGGGWNFFLPQSEGGIRTDNINLLNKWRLKMEKYQSSLVTNTADFRNINVDNTDYLFGLFSEDHLDYDSLRNNQPSLEEMTEIAIKILSKNKNGFFLMVEGGRIDHAHHASKAKLAILETLAFEKAVKKGFVSTNQIETLIAVTSDHSHVFTLGSNAKRENDITQRNMAIRGQEIDGKGHTSLLYSNGPGFQERRQDITDETIFHVNFIYNSGVPLAKETHGGEDVCVYARGPWSHLFQGVHHQSYVAHVMMYASCTGPYDYLDHCLGLILYGQHVLIISSLLVVSGIRLIVIN